MTTTASGYALIGRTFTRETFDGLYQASVATRRRERGGIWAVGRQPPAQSAWLAATRAPVFPSTTR